MTPAFITQDLEQGTFGHPWQQTVCVFGGDLTEVFVPALAAWLLLKRRDRFAELTACPRLSQPPRCTVVSDLRWFPLRGHDAGGRGREWNTDLDGRRFAGFLVRVAAAAADEEQWK